MVYSGPEGVPPEVPGACSCYPGTWCHPSWAEVQPGKLPERWHVLIITSRFLGGILNLANTLVHLLHASAVATEHLLYTPLFKYKIPKNHSVSPLCVKTPVPLLGGDLQCIFVHVFVLFNKRNPFRHLLFTFPVEQ